MDAYIENQTLTISSTFNTTLFNYLRNPWKLLLLKPTHMFIGSIINWRYSSSLANDSKVTAQKSITKQDVHLHEKLNEASAHPSIDDDLDLFVRSIRQVGQGPASVRQYVGILVEKKPRQIRQARRNHFEIWWRCLSPAQVWHGPNCIPCHW